MVWLNLIGTIATSACIIVTNLVTIEIFRPINKITDPLVHRDAMRLLRTVIDILADAQEQSDYKPKAEGKEPNEEQSSVINVLGPWLFEAAELQEYGVSIHLSLTNYRRKFDEGKAVAYSALCRLICRHTDEFVPVDLLAHFYEIVKKVLRYGA
jgi:hypothetical protein